ncbi:gluconokinase [Mucilaginibacter terrae]|uniref:gluconokinase n=1 Tax=Mucilaginibacter terrae TaxID=1955052 RepID=UPI003637B6F0
MKSYILGIDIGTGSTKGVALSLAGETLASSQHRYPIIEPQPGFSEQDPELIWQAFVQCVQEITKKLNQLPEAISFSSAMHSLILVDADGKVLNNMITWADTRSESIAQRLRDSEKGEAIYRNTGTPIHPMTPLCKLIWLRENEAELFKRTTKFISIKEYIWYKLFNKFEVDYAIASATGLFDIKELRWNEEACQLAGVTADVLSEPVDTNYQQKGITADMASLLGITEDTAFVIGASDGCCANLGSYVTGAGMAALTIGTSGAVRTTGSKPVFNYKAMPFNYLLNKNTFVSGGAVNNGGIAVDWLLKKFLNQPELNEESYNGLFKAIDSVPAGSEGLIFLPYLYGERAPIWDANSSGAYLNIQPKHGQAHFLRAGLEGICYALNDVLGTLEEASGSIKQINISGGFIDSATWVQILADITGKKLVVLQMEDASTIGAIYLAMETLYPDKPLPVAKEQKVVEPGKANHEVYTQAFPLYKKLYADLKGTMQLLQDLR